MTTLEFLRQYGFLIQRHGNAPVIEGHSDDERILSDRGKEQAQRVRVLRIAVGCNPVLTISSPLVRAVVTAAITSDVSQEVVVRCPHLAPACALQRDTDLVNATFDRLKYVPLDSYVAVGPCFAALLAWSTQVLEALFQEIRRANVQPRQMVHIVSHAVFGPALAFALLCDTDQRDNARLWNAGEAETMVILPGGVFGDILTP